MQISKDVIQLWSSTDLCVGAHAHAPMCVCICLSIHVYMSMQAQCYGTHEDVIRQPLGSSLHCSTLCETSLPPPHVKEASQLRDCFGLWLSLPLRPTGIIGDLRYLALLICWF